MQADGQSSTSLRDPKFLARRHFQCRAMGSAVRFAPNRESLSRCGCRFPFPAVGVMDAATLRAGGRGRKGGLFSTGTFNANCFLSPCGRESFLGIIEGGGVFVSTQIDRVARARRIRRGVGRGRVARTLDRLASHACEHEQARDECCQRGDRQCRGRRARRDAPFREEPHNRAGV